MELENRKRLQKNYCLLVDNLQFSDIQDLLFQENVLDDEEVELIESIKTTKAKIRQLLKILKSKDGVFEAFCRVLRESDGGYSYIADALENTEIVATDEDLVDGSEQSNKEKLDELMKQCAIQTQVINEFKEQNMEVAELLRRLNSGSQSSFSARAVVQSSDTDEKRFAKNYFAQFLCRPSDGDRRDFSFNGLINYFRKKSQVDTETVACRLGIDLIQYFLKASGYDIQLKPADKFTFVMIQMVEEVLEKYGATLEACVTDMHKDEMNGYFAVESLADELFQDGQQVNWGRIVSWYAFWVKCVISGPQLPLDQLNNFIEFYGKFIGFYMARRLHGWIANEGGWAAFIIWNERGHEVQKRSNSVGMTFAFVVQILFEYFPFQP